MLDEDIQAFFDVVNYGWRFGFRGHRVADRRILRLVQLRAGVSGDGKWSKTTVGPPQGSVASPFLANVYLHYVLDLWGRAIMTLPQPTAFSVLTRGFDGECPCCRRRFTDTA